MSATRGTGGEHGASRRRRRHATSTAREQSGAEAARLGLALVVIAAAQLMVVLDATIVNVALPHIQDALHFSGTNLEWVVNAYTLAFGGLLLLGGRSGDLLGRRRIFIAGIALFALASLAGGFATDQAWLLTARVIQGIGGALAAPASLSLIAVTFPEGKERNRAMGVYSARVHRRRGHRADRRRAADQLRRLALGVLRERADRPGPRAARAPGPGRVGAGARQASTCPARSPGRWAWAPWSTGFPRRRPRSPTARRSRTGGAPRSSCRWWRPWCCSGAFAFIEARSRHALVPPRVLASRDRTGAYLISLCIGTAIFGMFFFMTIFVQQVWGYSPVRSGIAYLPMVAAIMVGAGALLAAGRADRRTAADDRGAAARRRGHVLAVTDLGAPARTPAGCSGR